MRKIYFFMMLIGIIIMFIGSVGFAKSIVISEIEEQDRYKALCSDEAFDYSIDQITAHKIKHPYLKEDLFDVWIKMMESDSATYTYPETYVLKHYYVRISKRELQLIQTVQVRGDEMHSLSPERPYQEKNWMQLIPSSFEERLYQAIIKEMSQCSKGK